MCVMSVEQSLLAKEICFSIKESILERKPVNMSSMKKPLGLLPSQIISTLERSQCWMLDVLASQNFLPPFTGNSTLNFLLDSVFHSGVEFVTQPQLSCRFLPSSYSCWFRCQQITQDSPVRIPDLARVNNLVNGECGPGTTTRWQTVAWQSFRLPAVNKLLTFLLIKILITHTR